MCINKGMAIITLFGIPILVIAVALFLLAISIIDIKLKAVPKILTSAVILVLMIVNIPNIFFGLIATMFGFLLWELGEIGGIADIKAMTIIGLMLSNVIQVFVFFIVVAVVGLLYKAFMKYVLKKKQEIAFIPVYFITFILMNVIQFTFA